MIGSDGGLGGGRISVLEFEALALRDLTSKVKTSKAKEEENM